MDVQLKPANVNTLTKDITWEILGAFSLPRDEFWQKTIGPFFHKPAYRFSEIFAQFDQDVYDQGLTEACRRLVVHFVDGVKALNTENVPSDGPLLIASNHPGIADGVSIIANTDRDDTKVVVGGMPFLQSLPVAKHSTLCSHRSDQVVRANVVRNAIHHLKDGGAVLIFPSGEIDPDPSILPGAREALDKWSKSIAIMLRRVPETKFLPVIVSGILHEKFSHSPLAKLKSDGVGKRRIMEFIQVMRQLVFREELGLEPLLTFGETVTIKDLGFSPKGDAGLLLQALIEQAKNLFDRHTVAIQDYKNLDE
jgi:1-acyl-sn-glycerol-3-phosphate acyltransferase